MTVSPRRQRAAAAESPDFDTSNNNNNDIINHADSFLVNPTSPLSPSSSMNNWRLYLMVLIFAGTIGSLSMLYHVHKYDHDGLVLIDLQQEQEPSRSIENGKWLSENSSDRIKIDRRENHTATTTLSSSSSSSSSSSLRQQRHHNKNVIETAKTLFNNFVDYISTNNDNLVERNQRVRTNNVKRPSPQYDSSSTNHPPLNIVLFYADDWTMNVLGKLNKDVYTPNIDKLADNGMLFTNNCVTTSVCWISRASLVTGTYYARHQQSFPHLDRMFTTHNWTQTLFPKLRLEANYYTGMIGKWHAPQPPAEIEEALSYHNLYYGFHWDDQQQNHITNMNQQHAKDFLRAYQQKQLEWKNQTNTTNTTTTDEIQRKFFLKVSFFATHALDGQYPSYQPMDNVTRQKMYPPERNISLPKTATNEHWNTLPPFIQHENSEGRIRWKKRFEPEYFQDNIKDLYTMAYEVDWAVGEIIQELELMNIMNDTMIIFTTDNGNLHGEHGLAEKWYPFEESIRVPLVIYDPRMPPDLRGTVNDNWTLNIDLAPTILGAANLQPSDFMQGRDIAQLYLKNTDDQTPAWRQDWFYEFNMGNPNNASDHPWMNWIDASFALINDEWKYVYWPQQDYEQLFHRSVDPYDEWDLLHRIEDNNNKSFQHIQTTDEIYKRMKNRYNILKERAQSGYRI